MNPALDTMKKLRDEALKDAETYSGYADTVEETSRRYRAQEAQAQAQAEAYGVAIRALEEAERG